MTDLTPAEGLYGEAPQGQPGTTAPGILDQVLGVFTEPVALFKRLAVTPVWKGALGVTMACSVVTTIIWGLKVDVDAMIRPILEANPSLSSEQVDKAIEMQSKFIVPGGVVGVLVGIPIFLCLAALGYWLLGKGTAEGEPPSYQKALSATVAASPGAALPAGTDAGEMIRRAALSTSPGGGTIGQLDSGTVARVVAHAGGWSRVQVEAWIPDSVLRPYASGVIVGVSQAEVRANPGKFVGQMIEWTVQFVAVQKADELRPEIPAGRTYLLTRGPLPETGFVYVIVPPEQVAAFEALPPLKELTIRGTIRAVRTRYLPTPVLELVRVMEGLNP